MFDFKEYWNRKQLFFKNMGSGRTLDSSATIRIKIGNEINNLERPQCYNKIHTSKNELFTFFLLSTFNQFMRFGNFYFLFISIIAFCLDESPISPLLALIPLIVVIMVSISKQCLEYHFRKKTDELVNQKKFTVVRGSIKLNVESQFIAPGDLVIIKENMYAPCDLVLLRSMNERKCIIKSENLDGDTNLKMISMPHGLPELQLNELHTLGYIECEPPSSELKRFTGKIEMETQTIALSAENLLLRGVCIKDTQYVVGCAVYMGMQSKMGLNTRLRSLKTSTVESYLNTYMMGLVLVIIVGVTFFYFLERYDEISLIPHMPFLGPPAAVNSFNGFFNEFFSLLVLFSYAVPVPLYATIEVYRVFGAWFMQWDIKLYDDDTDQPCIARTSDLNEELGEINFLFCDKTGTITKNEMKLEQCSIRGAKYFYKENYLQAVDTGEIYDLLNFEADQYNFFEALTLCHTVKVVDSRKITDSNNLFGQSCNESVLDLNNENYSQLLDSEMLPKYYAKSSDEKTLVAACFNLGLIYKGEENSILKVRLKQSQLDQNDSHFQRLHVLENTSEQKRMSVILEDKNNVKWIYTKGACSSVLPLCLNTDTDLVSKTCAHITDFSNEGLRTLIIARKKICDEDYEEFLRLKQLACDTFSQKDEITEKCNAILECELELLGATAIKDSLQDDVNSTLVSLRLAGIKVWLLTGDTTESAVSTAISCGIITADISQHMIVGCENKSDLLVHLDTLNRLLNENNQCALIIDSQSVNTALVQTPNEFRELSIKCSTVICCHLSPLQKGQIVRLVKTSKQRFITAAIGDGANDISMLQAAHVGIALTCGDGNEAVVGADFTIAKFSMLKRLLLVHGHYNMSRLSLLINYHFYENILIAGCMFIFQFFNMHSANSVIDSIFLALYTRLYNSLPAIMISLTEKPYSEETLLEYPELYTRISRYRTISLPAFLTSAIGAFLLSLNIVLSTFFWLSTSNAVFDDGQTAGLSCVSIVAMQCVVIVGTLKLWLDTKFMSYWYLGSLVLSVLTFFISTFIYNVANTVDNVDIYGAYNYILSSLSAWLFTILSIVACNLPDVVIRYLRESFKLPKTWSCAQSGFVRTLQDWNILWSEELVEH